MSADFQKYLQSVCNAYHYWWSLYTITDVEGSKPVQPKSVASPFDFGLMVQTVQPQQQEKRETPEKTERLPVQEGLRKYSETHVLLVGRPGSGKSTALARLLLEEAENSVIASEAKRNVRQACPKDSAISPTTATPILVELRQYNTSVLELIQNFLLRHDPNLTFDSETLKTWLRQGQFLLLLDGLNELPNEDARRELKTFCQNYPHTPMIFTTRDLGVGGDLGIKKKLEMQPLTEEQMQEFVRAYLPEQGEEMLRRLGGRLREFGQTPLLLWMLCELFKITGNVPPNLGLVFRCFAQSYDGKIKDDVPVSGESRRWWQELLQHLAFAMMQAETPTELRVTIERQEAQAIFTKFLEGKVDYPASRAREWLEDLLKHHLIQIASNQQIEFRHQLLQEYYAAECLLQQLPKISNEKLKRDYLNYLKWTEPLALMLALVDKEAQAVRVVQLALNVDLMLGARLAGEVKEEFQEKTVGLVLGLEVNQRLKIELLGMTRSEQARSPLQQARDNRDYDNVYSLAEALSCIGDDQLMSELLEWEDKHTAEWNQAKFYEDYNNHILCERIASELENIESSDVVVLNLVKLLNDKNLINKKGSDQYLKPRNYQAQAVLGEELFNQTISFLLKALKHEDFRIRYHAALALGNIGSDAEACALFKIVEDENYFVRSGVVEALGRFRSYTVITPLIKALNDEKAFVRSRAAEAVSKFRDDKVINALIQASKDEKFFVRSNVVKALGKMHCKQVLEHLIKALNDENSDVRQSAVIALGELAEVNHSNQLITDALISALNDEESSICSSAIDVMKQIKKNRLIALEQIKKNRLINSVLYEESLVSSNPVQVEEVVESKFIPQMQNLLLVAIYEMKDLILEIQERCKFYNHKIFHSPPVEEEIKTKSETSKSSTYIIQRVGNLNTGDVNIHGNQIGTQHNQLNNKD
ncbi:hypothetical protein DP113_25945 [Brasilonema octagenarum UFV-E1]|uniref:NACHT domain-containing protein n=1 Tax=Brasilonema sennae CENA114 TaxID=415709 RepID=A0A856ML97_9CYAN|nr:HEAT repeat domain-containing protein [Brasilonema sennae]QDL10900.1 hypothetical protein DP114_26020 [Brasilonema sennae CENA114]QDL17247.1 hypothetical protein DP113_25945 [Brasilonema octagenarum UFV-E1]